MQVACVTYLRYSSSAVPVSAILVNSIPITTSISEGHVLAFYNHQIIRKTPTKLQHHSRTICHAVSNAPSSSLTPRAHRRFHFPDSPIVTIESRSLPTTNPATATTTATNVTVAIPTSRITTTTSKIPQSTTSCLFVHVSCIMPFRQPRGFQRAEEHLSRMLIQRRGARGLLGAEIKWIGNKRSWSRHSVLSRLSQAVTAALVSKTSLR